MAIYTPKVLEVYSKCYNPGDIVEYVRKNIKWFDIFNAYKENWKEYNKNFGGMLSSKNYVDVKTPEEVILSRTATCYNIGTFFCYWLLYRNYKDVSGLVVKFKEGSLYNNHAFSWFREGNTWSTLFAFVIKDEAEYLRGFLTLSEFIFYLESRIGPVERVYLYSTMDREKLPMKSYDKSYVRVGNVLIGEK